MRSRLHEQLRLRDLQLIDAIAREGALVGAARLLSQSQPATTKALQALEAQLDTRLFDRTAKGVAPTASGRLLAEAAGRILREMAGLDAALSDLKSGRGRVLNIGAETGCADTILMSALAHPDCVASELEMRIVEGSCEALVEDLAERRLDLVIGRIVDSAGQAGLMARPLYDEPIALIARAGHAIFDHEVVDHDLAGQFQAMAPVRNGQVAQEVEAFIQQTLSSSRRSVKSSSIALVKEMVHLTDCLAVGPATFMAGDIERGDARIVPYGRQAQPRPAGLIYRADAAVLEAASPFLAALSISAAHVAHLLAVQA